MCDIVDWEGQSTMLVPETSYIYFARSSQPSPQAGCAKALIFCMHGTLFCPAEVPQHCSLHGHLTHGHLLCCRRWRRWRCLPSSHMLALEVGRGQGATGPAQVWPCTGQQPRGDSALDAGSRTASGPFLYAKSCILMPIRLRSGCPWSTMLTDQGWLGHDRWG